MNGLAAAVGIPGQQAADMLAGLTRRELTIATAESLTGGLLAALLTEIPGSSAVVRGGLVVYATDLKHQLAGVDEQLLAERGPVDPLVATELADGARRVCGADIGVGLTGVAGPDPQHGIDVGTWFCAVSGPGGHRDQRSGAPADLAQPDSGTDLARISTRGLIRSAAVRAALEMLTNIAEMDS